MKNKQIYIYIYYYILLNKNKVYYVFKAYLLAYGVTYPVFCEDIRIFLFKFYLHIFSRSYENMKIYLLFE